MTRVQLAVVRIVNYFLMGSKMRKCSVLYGTFSKVGYLNLDYTLFYFCQAFLVLPLFNPMSQTVWLLFYKVIVCLDWPKFTILLAPHFLLHFRPSFLPSFWSHCSSKRNATLRNSLVMSVHSKLYFFDFVKYVCFTLIIEIEVLIYSYLFLQCVDDTISSFSGLCCCYWEISCQLYCCSFIGDMSILSIFLLR